MRFIPANRWQAFGIHIIISALLFLLLSSVIYFFWYPGFLFEYDGGLDGIKLIAGVDFLIGPFLTLCVYKLGKPGLRFDLAVIALLQAACLSGGMWTVWQTRSVAVVYSLGQFRTISYEVYKDYGVDPAAVPLLQGDWPVWVVVSHPQAVPQFNSLISKFSYQNAQYFKTENYVPYESDIEEVRKSAKTVDAVVSLNPELAIAFSQYDKSSMVYQLACGSGVGYLIMNQQNQIVDVMITLTRKSAYRVYLDKSKELLVKFRHAIG